MLQACQAVRDDLREHRDHFLRQVNARGPPPGFGVERPAGFGEVADVGDVNGQNPVLGFRIDGHGHRVVEVARIDGVDRDDALAGKVRAAVEVVIVKLVGLGAGFGECGFRELFRQSEGANDGQQVHAGLRQRAENFRNDALPACFIRREPQHLHDDLVLRLRPFRAGVTNAYAVREHRAVDLDKRPAVPLEVGTDKGACRAVQNPHHVPGRPGQLRRLAGELHHHLVAAARVQFLAFPNANIAAAFRRRGVGLDERHARVGPPINPNHRAEHVRRPQGVVLPQFDAPGGDQRLQDFTKVRVLFVSRNAHPLRQYLRLHRRVTGPRDGVQNACR